MLKAANVTTTRPSEDALLIWHSAEPEKFKKALWYGPKTNNHVYIYYPMFNVKFWSFDIIIESLQECIMLKEM